MSLRLGVSLCHQLLGVWVISIAMASPCWFPTLSAPSFCGLRIPSPLERFTRQPWLLHPQSITKWAHDLYSLGCSLCVLVWIVTGGVFVAPACPGF